MKINNFDWSPMHTLPLDEAVTLLFFNQLLLNLGKKEVTSSVNGRTFSVINNSDLD